jgi:hypothetical protein
MKTNYIQDMLNSNNIFEHQDGQDICSLVSNDNGFNPRHISMSREDWFDDEISVDTSLL